MATHEVVVLGAPWVEGQNLDGADLAPVAMRDAGLADAVKSMGLQLRDAGDVDFSSVAPKEEHHYSVALYRQWCSTSTSDNFSTWMRKRSQNGDAKSTGGCGSPSMSPSSLVKKRSYEKALSESANLNVLNVEVMGRGLKLVHEAVQRALFHNVKQLPPFLLTIGGDHSIASASIAALQAKHDDLGVIWIDAHADANTPRSSPSGHYHGMPAAHLLGWFDKPGELGPGVPPGAIRAPPPPRPAILPQRSARP